MVSDSLAVAAIAEAPTARNAATTANPTVVLAVVVLRMVNFVIGDSSMSWQPTRVWSTGHQDGYRLSDVDTRVDRTMRGDEPDDVVTVAAP